MIKFVLVVLVLLIVLTAKSVIVVRLTCEMAHPERDGAWRASIERFTQRLTWRKVDMKSETESSST